MERFEREGGIVVAVILVAACASQPPAPTVPMTPTVPATATSSAPTIAAGAGLADAHDDVVEGSPAAGEDGGAPTWPADSTVATCDACNGEVRVSMGPPPHHRYCLCRTHDRDKECRDGNECEGSCVWDYRKEQVTRTDANGDVYGYRLGRCSEFVGKRGCGPNIAPGITDRGPYVVRQRHGHWVNGPCFGD